MSQILLWRKQDLFRAALTISGQADVAVHDETWRE